MNRRQFLGAAAAATALGPGTPQAARPRLFASCGADRNGGYFVAVFDASGEILTRIPLAERGHDVVFGPGRDIAIACSRRPGCTLTVIDVASAKVAARIEAARNRHYFGHAVFSPDGGTFYATENDYDAGRGVIGVYDTASGFRRTGEFATGGIGPHQLRLMPDGRSLTVANGGILTHPDTGRAKLNLDDMRPSLVRVDIASGRIRARAELPAALHRLSIRHIDVNAAGTVAVAMQYEGSRRDRVPLLALAASDGRLRPLRDDRLERRMRHYTGSLSFDSSGRYVGVSAPRGNTIAIWDVAAGSVAAVIPAPDASGIAPAGAPGRFLATGGDGAIRVVSPTGATGVRRPDSSLRWDNHLAAA
jgi:hypothetical protein